MGTTYTVFDGNEAFTDRKTKRAALNVACKAFQGEQGKVGLVRDDGFILRMWNARGKPLRFESHGGEHGAWV